MSYTKHEWVNGEVIQANALNNLEEGIGENNMSYEKHTWVNGEVITADKLNHMEDGISDGGGGCDDGFSTATVTFEAYGGFTLASFAQIDTRRQPRKLDFIVEHEYESTFNTFSLDALLVDGVGKFYVDSEYATITVSGNATYDDGEVIYTGDCTISIAE